MVVILSLLVLVAPWNHENDELLHGFPKSLIPFTTKEYLYIMIDMVVQANSGFGVYGRVTDGDLKFIKHMTRYIKYNCRIFYTDK